MYKWKNINGREINWFSERQYNYNVTNKGERSWLYRTFSSNYPDDYKINLRVGYVVTDDYNTTDYFNNFVTNLPEKATLYFDQTSKFPRTKLTVSPFKRTVLLKKADVVVIKEKTEVYSIQEPYYIFTDSIDVFAIKVNDLRYLFNNDINQLIDSNVNVSFRGKLQILYQGNIKVIIALNDTISKFNSNLYNCPFILDNDLDVIINQYLPDPDLDTIVNINEMLLSSDVATVKLAITMVTGFNISKWKLTFRCLLLNSSDWKFNTVAIKQMMSTLDLNYTGFGITSMALYIQSVNETYSKEDIMLAQSFVRTLPRLEAFCKRNQPFYLESLPFIPDEYKK